MKIRTLIVDDEPLARERLTELLRAEPNLEIIGECVDGREALETIRRESPELVFLDVRMPELDGFDVLAGLTGAQMPVVIFVTAYDQFALRAFEVHAFDYLLKPFDRERLRTAVERAVAQIKRRQPEELNLKLAALLAELKPESAALSRLAIKAEGRVLLIRTDEIDWIEAADNYVNIHVGEDSHLHRETMTALEARLAPDKFMRISRSAIVNVDRVKEMQPMFHGDYVLILRNGARLNLSRSYRDKLPILLGQGD